jgi:hypothetical protein
MRLIACLLLCGVAGYSGTVIAQSSTSASPLQFVPLQTPCRAIDTRVTGGPIAADTSQNFNPAGGACSIPNQGSGPIAYAMNITVVPHGSLGFLSVWPAGEAQPLVSTLNSTDGRVKANAAIVPGGNGGEISVYASGAATDLILDVSGYFIASTTDYVYVPITPCRMVDTRSSNGSFGAPSLVGGQQRAFELASSSCNLPGSLISNGGAVSFNVTAVPVNGHSVSYVTVWGTSSTEPQTPLVSTLNVPTGTVTANAAIVPINPSTSGSVSVYATDNTDLLLDITGYFLPANQAPSGLALYTLTPCRVLDTRLTRGEFQGELTIPFTSGNSCNLPASAQAFAVNATVIPAETLGYLALWPDGVPQPTVSTLNAEDGFVTSNMAIVGSSNGSIDAYATNPTQLILDVSGYFAAVPSFTLTATPTGPALQPGGVASLYVMASPVNQFTGTISATLTPSAGLTVTPSTISLVPGVGQTVSVSASESATTGSISIQANAQGITKTLNVPIAVGPNFSIEYPSGVLQLTDNVGGAFVVEGNPDFYSDIQAQVTGFPPGLEMGTFIGPSSDIVDSPATTLTLEAQCQYEEGGLCPSSHYSIVWNGAAAGTYPLTLTATSGAITHTESLTLVVTPPVTNLSASPASVSIPQGGTQTVELTATGYAASHTGTSIGLGAQLPSGISLSPTWNSSGPSPLVFTVSPTATIGTYVVTVVTSTPVNSGGAETSGYPVVTASTQVTITVGPQAAATQ